ncbi:hypothetical protein QR685DRAFT_543157 [Neurospora intermedia]|uniref:Uncharacterized protein n=1 Tax=Neurospora intermedia TaxID=5142 RepID=A0ABR3DGY2_NEUIN
MVKTTGVARVPFHETMEESGPLAPQEQTSRPGQAGAVGSRLPLSPSIHSPLTPHFGVKTGPDPTKGGRKRQVKPETDWCSVVSTSSWGIGCTDHEAPSGHLKTLGYTKKWDLRALVTGYKCTLPPKLDPCNCKSYPYSTPTFLDLAKLAPPKVGTHGYYGHTSETARSGLEFLKYAVGVYRFGVVFVICTSNPSGRFTGVAVFVVSTHLASDIFSSVVDEDDTAAGHTSLLTFLILNSPRTDLPTARDESGGFTHQDEKVNIDKDHPSH